MKTFQEILLGDDSDLAAKKSALNDLAVKYFMAGKRAGKEELQAELRELLGAEKEGAANEKDE